MNSTSFQPTPMPSRKRPPRQHVETGRLLGDEHGLALRQDQDAGRKAELLRAAGEIAEQHERVVEQIVDVVAVPARPARGVDPEHMVGRLEEIVADRLRRLRVFAHDRRLAADIAPRQ